MVINKKFKVGDILLFSWDSWVGDMIRINNYINYGKSEENKWTHAAIIGEIRDDKINAIVYEALNKGFTPSTYSIEQLNSWIDSGNMIVGNSNIKLNNVFENCEKYKGTKYGWLDIFSIAIYTMFRRFKFTIPTGAKNIICSEAVARILYDSSNRQIDFEQEYAKRYDLITPCDLYYSRQIKWQR